MVTLQKILCPIDFSECSLEALRYATHIAQKEDATLFLLHIVDIRIYDYAGPAYEPEFSPVKTKIDQISTDILKQKLLEKIPKEIKGKVETVISFGIPFVEIIKTAKDNDVNLIVMGTHGRSGITHILIGSVAEKVVRKASCAVLTVKKSSIKFDMP